MESLSCPPTLKCRRGLTTLNLMVIRSVGLVAAVFLISGCGLVLDLDPPDQDQGMDATFPDGGSFDAGRNDAGMVDSGVPDGGQTCERNRECPPGDLCFAHSRCVDGVCSSRLSRPCPIPPGSCAEPTGCDSEDGCLYGAGTCPTSGYDCVAVDDPRRFACQNVGSCAAEECPAVPCGHAFCDSADTCAVVLDCAEDQECCAGDCVPAGCEDGNPCTEGSCTAEGCTQTILRDTACHPEDDLCVLGSCTNAGICEPRGDVTCGCGTGGVCESSTGDCVYDGGGDPPTCDARCVRDGVCDAAGNCVGERCEARHECEVATCDPEIGRCVVLCPEGDTCGDPEWGAECRNFVCRCPNGLPVGPEGCSVVEVDAGPLPDAGTLPACDVACGSDQQCCCGVCIHVDEPCPECMPLPVD